MKIEPRTHFYISGKTKSHKMYSSPHRARIFASVKARNLIKQGNKIRVRVIYGKSKCALGCICVFDNEGTYTNYNDLKIMTNNFLDEDLWIKGVNK